MDHPAGGTCDQTPQRACRRERHAPGRGTSPRQSPCGRNVTPDLGAERIDGGEVEQWRHDALLELRAMIDTGGAHCGTDAVVYSSELLEGEHGELTASSASTPALEPRTRRAATSTPT